eukprot:CAMPEP_0202818662 /NCGR_PEP_ID=MMETSP1389-20130828/8509_1 /ASSEMBLY_ACC=CAM_ASM_000865 /TAXON_ID=302021 /ORGANISM="Rhodomonas sp., Strain CCMP768" /LENGTH=64 /DNA_ID=CAMNT_0049491061 /DNA_START=78 /DNA_END=269 /DNA_ORIENTATION=+
MLRAKEGASVRAAFFAATLHTWLLGTKGRITDAPTVVSSHSPPLLAATHTPAATTRTPRTRPAT